MTKTSFKELPGRIERTVEQSLPVDYVKVNTVPRKPVKREQDLCANAFYNRPAAYLLRESSPRLLREWKAGLCIRALSRKYRVTVRDIEQLLRREVA